MSRCEAYIWRSGSPDVTPLSTVCSLPLLSLLWLIRSNSRQVPQSLVRIWLERRGGSPGFPVLAVSQNDFMPSLWMSVSSSVSEGAAVSDPIDPFQVGSV